MDGRMLKVLYCHIITSVHLIVSDESFERPSSITLIQHQVGRTLGLLWRMSHVRSFSCRRKIFRLDRWNGLDGNQVHCWVVQVYRRRSELWNLGKRSLARILLLGTSTTWKVTKVHKTGYAFPLPGLGDRLLDNQGSCIVLDLDVVFTHSTTCNNLLLVFLHGGQPYGEEDKVSNMF